MTKYKISATHYHGMLVSNDSQELLATDISPLTNFLNRIISPSFLPASTGIMPPGVLSINDSIIVYERPPQFQNIQIIPETVDNINYEKVQPQIYRLPIPWQLYICTYSIYNDRYYPNSVRMFFMNSSLTSSDIQNHRIYLPTLPNFYSSGLLCNPMFASMEDIERYDNNISGVIQASYDWIWNSGTNIDLTMPIVEAFYQLPKMTESGIPTLFDNIPLRYAHAVSPTSYYISFNYIDMFFRAWEKYELHQISQLAWPNAASEQKLAHTVSSHASDSLLAEYLATVGIDPQSTSEYSYSFCDDEECEECRSEELPYNYEEYLRFVKDKLCNVRTFADAYNDTLNNLHQNVPHSTGKMQRVMQDIYLKSLSLT